MMMTNLDDIMDPMALESMIEQRYVKRTRHPRLSLWILNYTASCQYDRVWNDVTRQCRGLIVDARGNLVARPWPKFHNYGEHEEGALDLEAEVRVTDKLDGSLGILYPDGEGWAIATRGSFTSDQALHATERLRAYIIDGFTPVPSLTWLFEIIYPTNRIVVDYGSRDELVLLGVIDTASGRRLDVTSDTTWPGFAVESFEAETLAQALELPPRPNSEGVVVEMWPHSSEQGEMVKLKQEDYVALHRIMTGTNARNVWEYLAVNACKHLIDEPKHWGSFVGIDPARAEEILFIGDGWLDGLPDEFYSWVTGVTERVKESVEALSRQAYTLIEGAGALGSAKEQYEAVKDHPLCGEIMRALRGDARAHSALALKAWRLAEPEPEAPFARSEDEA